MKFYADKRRLPHSFNVGDRVFVKLRPYHQVSLGGSRIQKLAKRYFGPFSITRCIGDVAFELDLPPQSKIHLVFHAFMLKPCHGDSTEHSLSIPDEAHNNQPKIQPLAILDWREDQGSEKI